MTNDELPASVTENAAKYIWIDPRTQELCRRCNGTGKMPPWPGSNGRVKCGVCRQELVFTSADLPEPVRTYSEAEEVADSLKYIAETSHNAGVTEAYAALSGEFQKVTGKTAEQCGHCGQTLTGGIQRCSNDGYCSVRGQPEPKCSKCGQAITPSEAYPDEWVHVESANHKLARLTGCWAEAIPAVTPDPIVISSPAHFLPELKSDADHFAEEYRLQHDLPFSMVQHLAWAWLMGKQDERLKGGK